jgi:3-dehydroquinate dehydratase/shikimate dehydrogenase
MLCVVIKGPTFEEAHQQISKALGFADLVELRLDYFKSLDLSALHNLRTHFSIPMIFALRSQIHGGNY